MIICHRIKAEFCVENCLDVDFRCEKLGSECFQTLNDAIYTPICVRRSGAHDRA